MFSWPPEPHCHYLLGASFSFFISPKTFIVFLWPDENQMGRKYEDLGAYLIFCCAWWVWVSMITIKSLNYSLKPNKNRSFGFTVVPRGWGSWSFLYLTQISLPYKPANKLPSTNLQKVSQSLIIISGAESRGGKILLPTEKTQNKSSF